MVTLDPKGSIDPIDILCVSRAYWARTSGKHGRIRAELKKVEDPNFVRISWTKL